ncbi:MAG: cysteine hydrolase family protein [Steroidobacteraceae bacterium]
MILGPALVIIDMQNGMSRADLTQRNNQKAEGNMRVLLDHWRNKQAPIIHVRHVSRTAGSPFWPGQRGVEFQSDFEPRPNEHVVEKNVPDAFTNSGLERWLHQRSIGVLVIVGVSTSNSVEATARSAGNLGFKTFVVSDATFDFAKRDFNGTPRSADDVHAMSLANLHGEYVTVKSTAELRSVV